MSYEFERPEQIAGEVRRIVVERLNDALVQLSDEPLRQDRTVAVHTARKDLKKARSVMRLVRGSLAPDRFRSGNDRLRAAAHELAAVRESDAMALALAKLLESPHGMSDACSVAARELEDRLAPTNGPVDVGDEAARASLLIRGVRDDARLWALGYGSWEIIEPGIRRTYRLGRAGLAESELEASDETLHEWRKRVKDMWYSLRLLRGAWPPVMEAVAEEAHRVSELLGDHHDLGELVAEIDGGRSDPAPVASAELVQHARAKQAELHQAAIVKGRRLYAERPRRYSQRLEALWRSWESQS